MKQSLQRLTIGAADTEHRVSLPSSVIRVRVRSLTGETGLVSFESGKVELGSGNLFSLTDPFHSGNLAGVNTNLYVSSPQIGTVVEVLADSYLDATARAFSNGFDEAFA